MLEEFPPYCLNESQMEQLIPIEDVNNNYSCHGGHLPTGHIQTRPDDAANEERNLQRTTPAKPDTSTGSSLYIAINNERSTMEFQRI